MRRRKEWRRSTKQPGINKVAISTYLSIVTLNVNGPSVPKGKGWQNG